MTYPSNSLILEITGDLLEAAAKRTGVDNPNVLIAIKDNLCESLYRIIDEQLEDLIAHHADQHQAGY